MQTDTILEYYNAAEKWLVQVERTTDTLAMDLREFDGSMFTEYLMRMRWALSHLEAAVYSLDLLECANATAVGAAAANGLPTPPPDSALPDVPGRCAGQSPPRTLPMLPAPLRCGPPGSEYPWDQVWQETGAPRLRTPDFRSAFAGILPPDGTTPPPPAETPEHPAIPAAAREAEAHPPCAGVWPAPFWREVLEVSLCLSGSVTLAVGMGSAARADSIHARAAAQAL